MNKILECKLENVNCELRMYQYHKQVFIDELNNIERRIQSLLLKKEQMKREDEYKEKIV